MEFDTAAIRSLTTNNPKSFSETELGLRSGTVRMIVDEMSQDDDSVVSDAVEESFIELRFLQAISIHHKFQSLS